MDVVTYCVNTFHEMIVSSACPPRPKTTSQITSTTLACAKVMCPRPSVTWKNPSARQKLKSAGFVYNWPSGAQAVSRFVTIEPGEERVERALKV